MCALIRGSHYHLCIHVCAAQCVAYARKVSGRAESVASKCCETCCFLFSLLLFMRKRDGERRGYAVSKACPAMHEEKKAFVELIVAASVSVGCQMARKTGLNALPVRAVCVDILTLT